MSRRIPAQSQRASKQMVQNMTSLLHGLLHYVPSEQLARYIEESLSSKKLPKPRAHVFFGFLLVAN